MVLALMPIDHDERSAPSPREDPIASDPFRQRASSIHAISTHAHNAGDLLVERYRLVSLLGEGGMGEVWRAHSLALDIDVAVKVLRRGVANKDAGERLLREARAAASIGHPSIVRVFDFGMTDADEPYLVMELLEGESLATWLEREQRIAAGTAVQVLLPVMSALAAAHAQGIVHRDIKPENIVVTRGEGDARHPKLLDFGIVKFADTRGGRVLTEVGTLMGSPEYMSPEQAQGLPQIDGQTDVWSIAVVLYELITGKRPFSGSHSGAVLISIFRDAPVPTTQLAAGDEELWAIIRRGLEKEPQARWEGMRELAHALALWAHARGIETDAAGVSIARQWLGSYASVSTHAPLSEDQRFSTERAPPIDEPEPVLTPGPTVRSLLQGEASLPIAPARRHPARIALAAVLALVAVVAIAALGLRGSQPSEAATNSPAPLAATATVVPPSTEAAPAPEVPALTTPVGLEAPATPSALASSVPGVKRTGKLPSKPDPAPTPSQRPRKPAMPLPTAPNF